MPVYAQFGARMGHGIETEQPTRRGRGTGWGTIRKLPSGKFQARYRGPDGNRYAVAGFGKERAARDWLDATHARIITGTWRSPAEEKAEAERQAKLRTAQTFGTYAATWIDQRHNSHGEPLRVKTATEYRRALRNGLHRFDGDHIADITPERVRTWHAERSQKARTAAGAEARLLRAILNTAAMDGIIDRNPVPGDLTRTHTGIEHRPPTSGELAVLIDNMHGKYRLAVLLAAYGGLRRGEWAALRRRDIIAGDDRVRVNVERTVQYIERQGWHVGPPKSAEGVRVVPLPVQLTGDVQQHLAEHVGPFPDDLLFPGRTGGFEHPVTFNRAWNKAREAAGVRGVVREHDLRAYAATAFSQAGGTLRETMRLLGHSSTEAAMAYQYAATERMESLADMMGAPTTPEVTPLRREAQ